MCLFRSPCELLPWSWRILPCTFLAEDAVSIVSCLFIFLEFSSRCACCILAFSAPLIPPPSTFRRLFFFFSHRRLSLHFGHLIPTLIASYLPWCNATPTFPDLFLPSFPPSSLRAVCYCFPLDFFPTVGILRKCRRTSC